MIDFFYDFAVDELYLEDSQGSCAVNLATGDGRCSSLEFKFLLKC